MSSGRFETLLLATSTIYSCKGSEDPSEIHHLAEAVDEREDTRAIVGIGW
jgi:hypothetical protein